MPCVCTIPLTGRDFCPAWNEHLILVNERLRALNIPIIVDETDIGNKDVCFSSGREVKNCNYIEFMYLGNGVLNNIDFASKNHNELISQSVGMDAIFVTEKHITFVSFDVWFQIERLVILSESSISLSEGMNFLPQNTML